jgi:carbonic anhydrase/acetyltransferase-like protein (isoleucine patch superfamily)
MGSPAKVVRALTPEEQQQNVALAEKYVEVSRRFKALPPDTFKSPQH